MERTLLAVFLTLLIAGAWNYAFGGLAAFAALGGRVEDVAYQYLVWRMNVYVWILVPVLLVGGYFAQGCLPTITVYLQGEDGQARFVTRWYRPGSFQLREGWATWRERGGWACVEAGAIGRLGAFSQQVVGLRQRIETPDGIRYPAQAQEPYQSRTLHQRLQVELARSSAHRRQVLGAHDDGI